MKDIIGRHSDEMSVKEAYKVLHDNCGIEVGDRVKVLRKFKSYESGFGNSWTSEKASMIGKEFIVGTDLAHMGYSPENDPCSHYPFFVLELIEKAKPELPPIMVGACEVEFFGGSIGIGGGVMISKETLREILERLGGENDD